MIFSLLNRLHIRFKQKHKHNLITKQPQFVHTLDILKKQFMLPLRESINFRQIKI
jgi:hypothetical protein